MAGGETLKLPEAVRALGIDKTYAKDANLHHQDEVFEHICFVQSGRAFALSVDIEGDETWIAEFGPGQFLGCSSLFNDHPSSYRLVARTPLRALLFKRDRFLRLMHEHADLNSMVVRDLNRQVENLTRRKIEAHRLSMRGQIIAELWRMARPVGNDPGTFIIRPRPVFSDFAQRLGSSRETVSRTVSSLVKKDVLQRTTGALVVPNAGRLEREIK